MGGIQWRRWCCFVTGQLFSLFLSSRHSIPVDASNILYLKHNKRNFLRTETEIRVVFFTSYKYFFSHSFCLRTEIFWWCYYYFMPDCGCLSNLLSLISAKNNLSQKSIWKSKGISEWCMKCWLFRWWCRFVLLSFNLSLVFMGCEVFK